MASLDYWPGNVQARVVLDEAALGRGGTIAVDLVGHLGVGFKGATAVRETTPHGNLLTTIRADLLGDPEP